MDCAIAGISLKLQRELVRWKHVQAVAAPENANGAVREEAEKIMMVRCARCALERDDATSQRLLAIDVAEQEKWKKLASRAASCSV
jgi:hypothetical protein